MNQNIRNKSSMEYQKAIEYIFQLIKEGKLIVGSKIPSERDIAQSIGIGRNSIREAISILRGMGLIESVHGSGNYIAKDSGKSIKSIVSIMLALGSISKQEVLEFRKEIAKSVCRFVVEHGLTEDEKEHIQNILEAMKHAKIEELVRLDQEFHVTLIKAAKNSLFIMVMEPISEIYLELVSEVIENSDEIIREKLLKLHTNIYQSILKKDEEACLKYMTEHYEQVHQFI